MTRLARVVLPGYPHHITQHGNRRPDIFFIQRKSEDTILNKTEQLLQSDLKKKKPGPKSDNREIKYRVPRTTRYCQLTYSNVKVTIKS